MKATGIVCVLAALACAGPVSAQQPGRDQGGDRVIAAVTSCRAIERDADRLACFDRAAAALATAREAREIVVMDRQEVRERKRTLFGLPLPEIKLFGRDDDEKSEITEITSTIVSANRFGRGLWTIQLADGSIWRTSTAMRFDPEAKKSVTIRRGALGGFRGAFGPGNTVQVERVR